MPKLCGFFFRFRQSFFWIYMYIIYICVCVINCKILIFKKRLFQFFLTHHKLYMGTYAFYGFLATRTWLCNQTFWGNYFMSYIVFHMSRIQCYIKCFFMLLTAEALKKMINLSNKNTYGYLFLIYLFILAQIILKCSDCYIFLATYYPFLFFIKQNL